MNNRITSSSAFGDPMSLRIFHVVFVTVSVLLSLFVIIWGINAQTPTGFALAAVFVACAVALIVYGKRTFRKLKELP